MTAAPHRLAFLCGLASLLAASVWWGLHLLARYTGFPLFALDLAVAPIWAHSFLMLFTVFPTFFLGFLFTTYPRWMNGPLVPRCGYVERAAAAHGSDGLLADRRAQRASRRRCSPLPWRPPDSSSRWPPCCACCSMQSKSSRTRSSPAPRSRSASSAPPASATASWTAATSPALRGARGAVGVPAAGVLRRLPPHDPVLLAGRRAIGYVPWRPTWMLAAVVGLAWLRLLLGTAGALDACCSWTPRLFVLTALCAVRWTSLRARGNPLLWTLYAGYAWLPVAMLLQTARDARLRRERRVGARPRADPRARHGILRRHAHRHGDARHHGTLGPAARHGPHRVRLLPRPCRPQRSRAC